MIQNSTNVQRLIKNDPAAAQIKQDPSGQNVQGLKSEHRLGDNGLPLDHIDQDDAWTVIRSYFSQHGLVSQQISSFDRFLNFNVQEIINEIGKVQIDVIPQYVTGMFI